MRNVLQALYWIGALATGVALSLGAPPLGNVPAAQAAQYEEMGAVGDPFIPLERQLTRERLETLVNGRPTPAQGGWVEVHFHSSAVGKSTYYMAWLPPGYETSGRRYPTLYLLHGIGGVATGFGPGEWLGYGITEDMERLLALGLMEPMIVVLPEGGPSYWVNQADGSGRWADFVGQDLVKDVDARFRTDARRERRAIGGLSMGGHGALQIALNNPSVFAVAGAHSPALRTREELPAFFGSGAEFAKLDLGQLVTHTGVAPRLATWIDIAEGDPWRLPAMALRDTYRTAQGPLEFRVLEGEHEGWYWQEYLPEYLRWYASALSATTFTPQGAPIVVARNLALSLNLPVRTA